MSLTKKLALGTVQFGLDYGISNKSGRTKPQEVSAIFDEAISNGLNTIDTAGEYGESEKVIGNLHKNRFNIITKVKLNTTTKTIQSLVSESLAKLKTKNLHGVLYHNEVSLIENPSSLEFLKSLKKEEVIQNIGYTAVGSPEDLERLIDRFGLPDMVQIPYSHLDRRFETLADELSHAQVEVHCRSIFLQGLYFLNLNSLSPYFESIRPYLTALQEEYNNSSELAGALIRFVVNKPFVSKAVIGVNNLSQLQRNLNYLQKVNSITTESVKDINEKIVMPNLWQI